MSKAIYAFSGDPITFGHIDIIRRASKVFDELIVAIGINPDKKYLFSLDERTQLAKQALQNFHNVKVVSFTGLLIDFAYEMGVDVIVKGVRDPTDFQYEANLYKLGDSQEVGLDTFILISKTEFAHISSSNVKNLQKDQGLIHEYVPLNVKQSLEKRMSDQFVLTITGEIGSGKSYVSKQFIELGKRVGVEVSDIDLDKITRQIYENLKHPKYFQIRDTLVEEFGAAIKNEDGTINRKELGEIVFSDYKKLNRLNQIMHQPILVRVRKEMRNKKGLILLNAALMIESKMTYLSNNNVCLVCADKKEQYRRLIDRGLSDEQIDRRLSSQFSCQKKEKELKKIIDTQASGNLWVIKSNKKESERNIKDQFNKILKYFGIKAKI